MTKKITLFLDIDGVLLDRKFSDQQLMELLFEHWKGREEEFLNCNFEFAKRKTRVSAFSKEALFYLHQLISLLKKQGYEVEIIISSNWRCLGNVQFLKDLFFPYEFHNYIVDKIPNHPGRDVYERGSMIKEYLEEHQTIYQDATVLIIDDIDLGISKLFKPHQFTQCDNLFLKAELQQTLKNLEIDPNLTLDYLNDSYSKSISVSFDNIKEQLAMFQQHEGTEEKNIKSYLAYQTFLKQDCYVLKQISMYGFFHHIQRYASQGTKYFEESSYDPNYFKPKNDNSIAISQPKPQNPTYPPTPG